MRKHPSPAQLNHQQCWLLAGMQSSLAHLIHDEANKEAAAAMMSAHTYLRLAETLKEKQK